MSNEQRCTKLRMGERVRADIVIPAYETHALERCVAAVCKQELVGHEICSVTVVDDGSQPQLELSISDFSLPVVLCRNQVNRGRSAARNRGALVGTAPALVFLDSDLRLSSRSVLQTLLDNLESRHGIVQGHIKQTNSPFWIWYQDNSVGKKLEQSGPEWAGTTALVALLRKDFERLKGFDERFIAYGFEDRDFLYRAHCAGISIARCQSAVAEHNGDKSVHAIERKLHEAGRETAPLFRRKHAQAYKELPYAKIDFSDAPPLVKAFIALIYRAFSFCAGLFPNPKATHVWPYRLRRLAIRCLLALAFAAGTARSHSHAGSNAPKIGNRR